MLSHLQEGERLKVDVIVSWRAAGLTYITDHDGDATLVGVGIAVPSLQARQCSSAAILWESGMKWSFRCCQRVYSMAGLECVQAGTTCTYSMHEQIC